MVVPPLKYTCTPKLLHFFLDTFTRPPYSMEQLYRFRSVVLLSVLVPSFLGWVVHLNSHPVQSPSGVVAVAQCSVQMIFFLLQTLVVGAYGFGPV